MTSQRMNELHLDTSGLDEKGLEAWGTDLAWWQRQINWYIGDLAIAAKAKFGEDNYSQVFPPDVSPGLIQRCEAVARAYHPKDRNKDASWTIHMQHANKPNRVELVAAAVEAGRTSDEEKAHAKQAKQDAHRDRQRWLLAIDVNYHVTRMWSSGAETQAAKEVAGWIKRTVARLKEKGLTDVVCCFDSPNSFRKELTKEWDEDDRYKNRGQKEVELGQQLKLAEEMLAEFCCVKRDGFEADDIMASFAKQFDGRVTLLTVDKDMRQCLSAKCNMLVNVEWSEDPTTNEMLPDYKWVSAKQHTEGCKYSQTDVVGITPEQWTTFQCLAGDSSDNISGAVGIGAKIAADLIKQFGTVEAIIQAAKDGDERITAKKREALIEFESKYEITRQLVTLRTDLPLPTTTKIL